MGIKYGRERDNHTKGWTITLVNENYIPPPDSPFAAAFGVGGSGGGSSATDGGGGGVGADSGSTGSTGSGGANETLF